MSKSRYSLGLDFGTNSARALLVDVSSGREAGTGVAGFEHGEDGVLIDDRRPHLARQRPEDWERSIEVAVRAAIDAASRDDPEFDAMDVVGIGIDATASTPLPIDGRCRPLSEDARFNNNLAAAAWLWKDHTSHAEALEITELAEQRLPEHLARCGGAYSSEWFFAKLLRCAREAPDVLAASEDWVESGDWIAASLTGCTDPGAIVRNVCAAGHKGFFHDRLGLPPRSFLARLSDELAAWSDGKLFDRVATAGESAGGLSSGWSRRLGLPGGVPVSVAAIDAHVGAVGAGIRPGRLVKILGTSACDMVVHPIGDDELGEIPGLCGVVRDSITPGCWGLEAGQSAVGDIFGWFVREFGAPAGLDHDELTRRASESRPGTSGLLALDWNNGNRSILADPLLTGCIVGSTLRTTPAEIYRALLESTAFGARVILERMNDRGVEIDEVVLCGGVARKNDLLLQIYADVWRRPLRQSRSSQTCALGAAIFGAVAAEAHPNVERAQEAMTALTNVSHRPDEGRAAVYDRLFAQYQKLHDAFGGVDTSSDLGGIMKELLRLREADDD